MIFPAGAFCCSHSLDAETAAGDAADPENTGEAPIFRVSCNISVFGYHLVRGELLTALDNVIYSSLRALRPPSPPEKDRPC